MPVCIVSDDADWAHATARALAEHGICACVEDIEVAAEYRRVAESRIILLKPAQLSHQCWSACLRLGGRSDRLLVLVREAPQPSETILALELGADDCICASAPVSEIVARLRAMARRLDLSPSGGPTIPVYYFAGWRFSPATAELRGPGGGRVSLPANDLRLLAELLSHPGEVLSSRMLSERLDPPGAAPTDWRVRVFRLRNRLLRAEPEIGWLKTVPGLGYALGAEVVRVEETSRRTARAGEAA